MRDDEDRREDYGRRDCNSEKRPDERIRTVVRQDMHVHGKFLSIAVRAICGPGGGGQSTNWKISESGVLKPGRMVWNSMFAPIRFAPIRNTSD